MLKIRIAKSDGGDALLEKLGVLGCSPSAVLAGNFDPARSVIIAPDEFFRRLPQRRAAWFFPPGHS